MTIETYATTPKGETKKSYVGPLIPVTLRSIWASVLSHTLTVISFANLSLIEWIEKTPIYRKTRQFRPTWWRVCFWTWYVIAELELDGDEFGPLTSLTQETTALILT